MAASVSLNNKTKTIVPKRSSKMQSSQSRAVQMHGMMRKTTKIKIKIKIKKNTHKSS